MEGVNSPKTGKTVIHNAKTGKKTRSVAVDKKGGRERVKKKIPAMKRDR